MITSLLDWFRKLLRQQPAVLLKFVIRLRPATTLRNLRAIALALLLVLSFSFWALPACALSAPTFSSGSGSFTTAQTVSLSASSGKIYYTTSGAVPTVESTPYTLPISVTSPTQINAVAYQWGVYSPVSTIFLDIDSTLTPVLQSGLILRLNANFGLLTAGGAPASIAQWVDLSGLNNTATGAPGSQPTLSSQSPGFTAVHFDGSSQFLSLPAGFALFSGGGSFFIVARPVSPGTNARLFDLGNGDGINNIYMSEPSTNALDLHVYRDNTDSSVSASSVVTPGQFQLLEGVYDGSTTAAVYTNGVLGAQSSGMQTARALTRSNNFLAKAAGGGNFFSGDIAEVLLFSAQLSANQRAAVEEYFLQKYQLLTTVPRTPIISVASGTLPAPAQVAIASQPGAQTYVTTNGTTPDTSSLLYAKPLNVNYSQTVKAVSFSNGAYSAVSSATYTLDSSQWPAPNPSDTTAPTINLMLPAPTQ